MLRAEQIALAHFGDEPLPSRKRSKKRASRQSKKRANTRKSPKQKKLAKLRPVKPLKRAKLPKIKRPKFVPVPKATTRDLGKALSYLKKQGLFGGSTRVTKKRKSAAKKIVTQYEDVLKGQATITPLKADEAKALKRAGKRVEKGKLIEKKRRGIRRGRIEGMLFEEERIDGGRIIKVFTPYNAEHLSQGLERLENDPRINRLLKQGWRFALQIVGADGRANYSYATLPNIDMLRDYLQRYDALINNEKAINILTLIIILVDRSVKLPGEDYRKELRRQRRKQARQEQSGSRKRRGRSKKTNRSPDSIAKHRRYMREYMRQKRKSKRRYRK